MSAKHVLLTGPPGVGKTSLIRNICNALREANVKIQGFYTEEVRDRGQRIGFDVITITGQRNILARISNQETNLAPKVGKYAVNVRSFEELALPVFDYSDSSILILDEIGKMELFSFQFKKKVKQMFDQSFVKILATVPIAKNVIPFVEEIKCHKDCILINVTKENRNNLLPEILEMLLK